MSLGSHAACDGSQAHAATPDAAPANPHAAWVLATCILASSLAFVDGSAVNVGLPAIGHSLRAALAAGACAFWLVSDRDAGKGEDAAERDRLAHEGLAPT